MQKKTFKTSNFYHKIGRDSLFRTSNVLLKKTYEEFTDYIDRSDATYANRWISFVDNINFSSKYFFTDRFLYSCSALPLHEYEKEMIFLSSHVENKDFLSILSKLLYSSEINKFAYTKAVNNLTHRESFYLHPLDNKNYQLLDLFALKVKKDFPNKLFGVGIDFIIKKSCHIKCILK